jgi:FtsZ-interacting cell division protein ZipA
MSSLQIGLIVAGVLLVIGVIVYNAWQERRLKREAARQSIATATDMRSARNTERVEPTLTGHGAAVAEGTPAFRTTHARDSAFEPPLDVIPPPADESAHEAPARAEAAAPRTRVPASDSGVDAAVAAPVQLSAPRTASNPRQSAMPDFEIECLIPLHPAAPVVAGVLGTGLHMRVGKPLRWFGRADARSDWQPLTSDTPGHFADIVACMLLADRNGPASRAQIDTFIRVVGDIAPTLPAAFTPPDIAQALERAEALDRLCAEVDVQIGLTVQKRDPGSIPGTRLRGVAEASGFRLASGGRFEFMHEETGAVLYTLQNLRPDPFTAESLRLTATNGVVFVLDVARQADPVRAFDQMKVAAKRMATTLGAELVDDNQRPLDDAALASIREQVGAAAQALRDSHIEPGGSRALALFSA